MLDVKKMLTKLLDMLTVRTGAVTFNSGYSGTLHPSTYVKRQGNIVHVYIRIQPFTISAGAAQEVMTISNNFKPNLVTYGTAYYNSNTMRQASINANGKVVLNPNENITNGYIICFFSYIV